MSRTPPASVNHLLARKRHAQQRTQQETALLSGRPISVRWTRRAYAALQARATPLYVEMRLTLACLPKKQVFFREEASSCPTACVNDRLSVSMNVHIPAACAMRETESHAHTSHPTGCEPGAFTITPRWLEIDYARGQWSGEYGI